MTTRKERILEALLNDKEYGGTGVTREEKTLAKLARQQAGNGNGGGGVTRWDDLEGKPFYEMTEETVLIEEQTFTTENCGSNGCKFNKFAEDELPFELEIGKTYTVKFDGEEYKCVAELHNVENIVIGNPYLSDNGRGEDNGLPFLIAHEWRYSNRIVIYVGSLYNYDGDEITFTLKLSEVNEITVPLSDQYIPTTIPRTPTAEVGQVVRVKAVDANGVPTEWEAADMASGGKEEIILTMDHDTYVVTHEHDYDYIINAAKNRSADIYLKITGIANENNYIRLTSFEYSETYDDGQLAFCKTTNEYYLFAFSNGRFNINA